jgi:tRNA(Ile2) C34 agmatinyltransferase TiaS
MSASLAACPPRAELEPRAAGARQGEPTLEERLDAIVRTVAAAGACECPVCGGRLRREGRGGRCRDCGSALS